MEAMPQEQTLEKPAGTNVAAVLLDEYLELKERLGPLEKRLGEVRDRLRDLVTEHGHFSWRRFAVSLSTSRPASGRDMTPSASSPSFPGWLGA